MCRRKMKIGMMNPHFKKITKMVDCEHCLICHEYISKGNDPALCKDKGCKTLFEYECNFNKWAKEQSQSNK
jgi:hypothetical protein